VFFLSIDTVTAALSVDIPRFFARRHAYAEDGSSACCLFPNDQKMFHHSLLCPQGHLLCFAHTKTVFYGASQMPFFIDIQFFPYPV
jgi:hypothetical protein